ncbi:MAG: hypothetical protein DIZ80_07490 [endosymbiont of Galathealinum brachiosum]|uniref:Lipoprotein n=1 Tax=endosymbiont of Galathealinum brachiosum TaxID=2200906 RepID=A0A370DGC6_9GAMM|nr:MAG: hypothetical protein DIZ80_07490 [endosymbiont of Galathealinum brachiosum]
MGFKLGILKINYLSNLAASLCLLGLQACSGGGSSDTSTSTGCTLGNGANVAVSGNVTFDRVPLLSTGQLDFDNILKQEPVRGAVVEAICNGTLVTTNTDESGHYSLLIPGNTSGVFIRVKAQMLKTGSPSWNVSVSDEAQPVVKLIFAMDGSVFDAGALDLTRNLHADSGWDGSNYSSVRVAAPFAILDTIYDAMQLVLVENTTAQFPALDVKWSSNSTTGTFYTSNTISVLGRVTDTDEFDEHVIAHEWGHYYQDAFSRDDSIGGSHSTGDILDIRVAFSEGFGNAFSAMVTDDVIYKDSSGLNNGFTINIESNVCNFIIRDSNGIDNGVDESGWFSECSVQSALYDFYDDTNEGVDVLSLGFSGIHAVMTANIPDTDAVTSLFSFITQYKVLNAGSAANIDSLLLNNHSINIITDDEGTGQLLNPGDTNQLPIYATTFPVTSLCVTGENGGYNGLGVTRFVKFTVPDSRSYTFTAVKLTGGLAVTDPDMIIRFKGQIIGLGESEADNRETFSAVLLSGVEYVLELSEFDTYGNPLSIYTPTGSASDTTCFSITRT